MKAYKGREKARLKLWQAQTNTAAWIQGQYIAAAIGACLSKENSYPSKPLKVFKNDDGDEPEESCSDTESSDDAIRAQSKRIDRILAVRNQLPKEIIGAKRT